jgi:4-azaleucine resistance transporter AzlC
MTTDLKQDLRHGMAAAWPICLGYAPIGMAFGVIARQAGLTPLQIGLMSALVFAGSAQFIAVSMIASGAAALSIVLTTFIVNLRHLLMSSALTLFVKNEKKGRLALLAYGVTDESFAVNFSKYRESFWNTNRSLVVNHTANLAWIASTVIGGYGGQYIPPGAFGTDYALIAMFICLLVFQLNGARYVIAALLAGGLSVALALVIPGNIHIVLASVVAAALGVAIRRIRNRPIPPPGNESPGYQPSPAEAGSKRSE